MTAENRSGWIEVGGMLTQGYGVASGRGPDSPYPQGTIVLQTPHFRARGLDLSPLFPGTLNVSIAPFSVMMRSPAHTFHQVQWSPDHAPETFSFSGCRLIYRSRTYGGWIYYPHPETKLGHFQAPTVVEILAPAIGEIAYGDRLTLLLDSDQVDLVRVEQTR